MTKVDRAIVTLAGAAYERLRADLLSCRIAPGTAMRINELSTTLATNPIAIREALSRLSSEGLVVSEPQKGFRAAPISAADLRDLTHARIIIESMCLRDAIKNGGEDWEIAIVGALHRLQLTKLRDKQDRNRVSDVWAAAHTSFHSALTDGCTSATLKDIQQQLYARSERYRRLSVPLDMSSRDLNYEHDELAKLVLARDEEKAVAAMTKHLQLTTDILLQSPSSLPTPPD
jgi:DNA-binding GntR family transcriptional regulator